MHIYKGTTSEAQLSFTHNEPGKERRARTPAQVSNSQVVQTSCMDLLPHQPNNFRRNSSVLLPSTSEQQPYRNAIHHCGHESESIAMNILCFVKMCECGKEVCPQSTHLKRTMPLCNYNVQQIERSTHCLHGCTIFTLMRAMHMHGASVHNLEHVLHFRISRLPSMLG